MEYNPYSLAFAKIPRTKAQGRMATGDRGLAPTAHPGGFCLVPLGFETYTLGKTTGSFTDVYFSLG